MNHKDFGLRLKELRLSHKFTQAQLSNMVGISRQAYINYESGRTIPSAQTISKLSQVLNADLMELLCQHTTLTYSQSHSLLQGTDREELFSMLNLFTKLPPLSQKRIINLISLMAKGGEQ